MKTTSHSLDTFLQHQSRVKTRSLGFEKGPKIGQIFRLLNKQWNKTPAIENGHVKHT